MNDYKLIPFDLSKAKTPENPYGLEVVTRNGKKVRIIDTHKKGAIPIVTCVEGSNGNEDIILYGIEGSYVVTKCPSEYDLVLKKPIELRRMTFQELAWWLQDCPEEHREFMDIDTNFVTGSLYYHVKRGQDEVPLSFQIRKNGGEWQEPLVEKDK